MRNVDGKHRFLLIDLSVKKYNILKFIKNLMFMEWPHEQNINLQ